MRDRSTSVTRNAAFALALLAAGPALAGGGDGTRGGGDLIALTPGAIAEFVAKGGLKERVIAFLAEERSKQPSEGTAQETLLRLVRAGLERDARASAFSPKQECLKSEPGMGRLLPATASTRIGELGAEICFDPRKAAQALASSTLSDAKARLVALAVHELGHHFTGIVGSSEHDAKRVEDYVALHYSEPRVLGAAKALAPATASTGDRIYPGTDLSRRFPIEERTFLPIRIEGRTLLISPSGVLAESCLANLERPMTFSYVTGGYIGTFGISPGIGGRGRAELGIGAAQDKALSRLRPAMLGYETSINGRAFQLVPITFDVTPTAYVDGFGGVGYWARVSVSYVLLSAACSDVISQARERLTELRQALASGDERARRLGALESGDQGWRSSIAPGAPRESKVVELAEGESTTYVVPVSALGKARAPGAR